MIEKNIYKGTVIPKEILDAHLYISQCEADIGFTGSPEYYEKKKLVENYSKK